MPELPDLLYIEKKLNAYLPNRRITVLDIKNPIVFRMMLPGEMADCLIGQVFTKIERHGPFLIFNFESDFQIVAHLMLAGRFQWAQAGDKVGRSVCFSLTMDDGHVLHYLDAKQMGKVYLTDTSQMEKIPGFAKQGIYIFDDTFTLATFQQIFKKRRDQVRVFLLDHSALNTIGNAYADEILFDAHIHPKTMCKKLTLDDVEQLYYSIINVMRWGAKEVEKAQQPMEVKVRDHVKVRNRKGQPCPVCGTTIRAAGVRGYDAFYCPTCQPTTRKQFIQW